MDEEEEEGEEEKKEEERKRKRKRRVMEVVQRAGEVLFVPSGWFHKVTNLVSCVHVCRMQV